MSLFSRWKSARARLNRRARNRSGAPPDVAWPSPSVPPVSLREVDDPFVGQSAPSGLQREELLAAETEARDGLPRAGTAAPSGGEMGLRKRFLSALAGFRQQADRALSELAEERERLTKMAHEIEDDTKSRRAQVANPGSASSECLEVERRYLEAHDAKRELRNFRAQQGLSETAVPRASNGRWWFWLVGFVALESVLNAFFLYGEISLLLALAIAFGVSFLTVVMLAGASCQLLRAARFGGPRLRAMAGAGIIVCLALLYPLHVGLAHYRDAVAAQETSAPDALSFDGFGAFAGTSGSDGLEGSGSFRSASLLPPAAPISVGRAVWNELRTGSRFWAPGDEQLGVPSGELGYEVRDGEFWRVRDPRAGELDEWESFLLIVVGLTAFGFACWKWDGRNEPRPDWQRLHDTESSALQACQEAYRKAVADVNRKEAAHARELDRAVTELSSMPGRLDRLVERRRQILRSENRLLVETARAGSAAVDDYRAANRAQRPSGGGTPAFWESPWEPPDETRGQGAIAAWNEADTRALAECDAIRERVIAENEDHLPEAAATFRARRQRLAEAARLPAPPETLDPSEPVAPPPHPVFTAPESAETRRGVRSGTGMNAMGMPILLVLLTGLAEAACAGESCEEAGVGAGPPHRVAVVVDATDGFSDSQQHDLLSWIEPLARGASPDSEFFVYEVRDSTAGPKPSAYVQRPKHECEANPWVEPIERLKREWNQYLRSVGEAVRGAASAQPSRSSPIMETVQAAARNFGRRHPAASEGPPSDHLVIVSDLMQNRGVDFYAGIPSFAEFAQTRHHRKVSTRHLRGARVTVLQLPPQDVDVAEAALRRFWIDYFEGQGARRVRSGFVELEGS